MLKYTSRTAALIMVLSLICLGCQSKPQTGSAPASPGSGLSGASVAVLLTDQDNREVPLAALPGKPSVIAFIDTACPGPCKLTTSKLRLVAEKLGSDQASKVRFVLVTYNPVLDGPKRLTAYANEMKLDTSRWLLLTGSPERIDQVLTRFGLPRVGDAGDPAQLMDALDYVFLVAADGRVVKKYKGATFNTDSIAADAKQSLAVSSSPHSLPPPPAGG